MKKNNTILVITSTLILIGLIAFWLSRDSKPDREVLKDFAVTDTASIDKVFLADKNNNQVLLTKEKPGLWKVNNSFYARTDMMNNLMHAIKKVTVKTEVAKAAKDNIIKQLAVASIKVEIYKNGELFKTYYVGGDTQDRMASFMMMENSSAPFICYIPGHRGVLANFYHPSEMMWRDKKIFSYSLPEIASVTVNFNLEPEQDYTLEVLGKNEFKIKSLKTNSYLQKYDTSAVKGFLREFKNIAFEDYTVLPPGKMDTIRTKHQLFTITVKENSGNVKWVKGYRIPMPPGTKDVFDKVVLYDYDKMYGEISGVKENVILQYYTFDRIAKPIVYFAKK
jgi:hypothetical protein